jgi:hypothetical protein
MPKSKINYSNTCIYFITPKDESNNLAYVGSTTNFRQRKYEHKSYCNKETHHSHHYNLYQTIKQNGGWDAFDIYEVEYVPCENAAEKASNERYWYDFAVANNYKMMNEHVPDRGKKEYYQDTRAKRLKMI